ncbi:MAG: hypothetical protein M3R57_12315, partial [Chloroflexota bacterium]|nr:hypothetical protein [Chloroflexota bacterium]
VATTPVPRDLTSLLKDFRPATVRFEKSGGPATESARVQIGSVELSRRAVVGYSCADVPAGSFKLELVAAGAAQAWTEINGPCGGTVQHHQLDPNGVDGPFALWITVPAGASWRVAIGEYSESFATAPGFAPIPPTDGWRVLYELAPGLFGGEPFGPGVSLALPTDATHVAISVQCDGEAALAILLDKVPQGDAKPCGGPDDTTRAQFAAKGGTTVLIGVKTDGLAWIRFVVEVDGAPGTSWPSAPPMAADLATTAYAEAAQQMLALGTLGSNKQSLIRLDNATPGTVGGDYVAVQTPDGTGSRLDLWWIPTGSMIRTLARSAEGFYGSWVDPTHEQVFYGVNGPNASVEWHRVALDGSGDRVVATGAAGGLVHADIALDDSAFVADSCEPDKTCRRQVVDTMSGQARTVTLTGDAPCDLLGIADGFVVAATWPGCDFMEVFLGNAKPRITATPLDGGDARVLLDAGEAAVVVRSSKGAQLVYTLPGSESQQSIDVIDIATGQPRHLVTLDQGLSGPRLPSRVRVPADWVLLTGMQLGDFPIGGLPRPVPLLLNVVTGEQIELVNLPHSEP